MTLDGGLCLFWVAVAIGCTLDLAHTLWKSRDDTEEKDNG